MVLRALGALVCAVAIATVIPAPQEAAPRLIAIGDVHGSADGLSAILQSAGLIDAQRRWIGGRARLVQTGDFLDRGSGVRDVMELLMRLEEEAKRAGGHVEVLFGNHEGMNILHDFRDVSPDAFRSFAERDSDSKLSRAFDAHAAAARRTGTSLDRNDWMRSHPPGYVEYAESLNPSGRFGRWLRSLKVVVKLDDSIFMHAGIPVGSTSSLEDINRGVDREVRAFDDAVSTLRSAGAVASSFTLQEVMAAAGAELTRMAGAQRTDEAQPLDMTVEYVRRLQRLGSINQWTLITGEGPLWYRGYASLRDDAQPQIEALLKRLGAARLVIGHNAVRSGRITPRFGNRVFLIDTGMLSSFYQGGRPSALEIEGGRITAVYTDERQVLISNP